MLAARMSSKGQITLPKQVREALGIKPGERIVFLVEGNVVLLRPLEPGSARALAGSLSRYARPGSPAEVQRVVEEEVARAAAHAG